MFAGKDQDKFNEHNREAIMLNKLSGTEEKLLDVPSGKSSTDIWKHL